MLIWFSSAVYGLEFYFSKTSSTYLQVPHSTLFVTSRSGYIVLVFCSPMLWLRRPAFFLSKFARFYAKRYLAAVGAGLDRPVTSICSCRRNTEHKILDLEALDREQILGRMRKLLVAGSEFWRAPSPKFSCLGSPHAVSRSHLVLQCEKFSVIHSFKPQRSIADLPNNSFCITWLDSPRFCQVPVSTQPSAMESVMRAVRAFDTNLSKSTFGRVFRLDGSGHVRLT